MFKEVRSKDFYRKFYTWITFYLITLILGYLILNHHFSLEIESTELKPEFIIGILMIFISIFGVLFQIIKLNKFKKRRARRRKKIFPIT